MAGRERRRSKSVNMHRIVAAIVPGFSVSPRQADITPARLSNSKGRAWLINHGAILGNSPPSLWASVSSL
jgi:hypothetical protein